MNAPTAAAHLLPAIALRDVPQALLDALQTRFGAQCSLAQAVREQHGRDEGSLRGLLARAHVPHAGCPAWRSPSPTVSPVRSAPGTNGCRR